MFTPQNTDFLSSELQERYRDNASHNRPHWRYLVIGMSKDSEKAELIHAEPVGQSMKEVQKDLLNRLPEQDVCWIAFNLPYRVAGGGKRSKTLLISWVPDTMTRPRRKEVIEIRMASILQGGQIKSSLGDVTHSLRASCGSELTLEAMIEVASRYEREPVCLAESLAL